MFTLTKRREISGAHRLSLPYPSKCQNLHGHNWIVIIKCQSETLDENGMVVDFTKIKKVVKLLDHANVNDVINEGREGKPLNPTAENIAYWLCHKIPNCVEVSVQESEGNVAVYAK